ncbi:MAG: B3/B4 domain-containing protein, partial [Chloroflexota bacterium]
CIGLVVARGVDNTRDIPALEASLRAVEAELVTRFEREGEQVEQAFLPWRTAFSTLGISPSRFRSSVEALAGRARK